MNKQVCTFVNNVVLKSSGRKVLDTHFKGKEFDGSWECDIINLRSGNSRNGEWLTMDENLKECYSFYKDKDYDDLENLEEFEVIVEFTLSDNKVVDAVVISK